MIKHYSNSKKTLNKAFNLIDIIKILKKITHYFIIFCVQAMGSNNEQIYNPKNTKFLEKTEALKWAKERTDKTAKACQSMPTYKVVKKEPESLCYDQRNTPFGAIRKGYVYNFGWIIKTRKGYGVGHWLRITQKINQSGKF